MNDTEDFIKAAQQHIGKEIPKSEITSEKTPNTTQKALESAAKPEVKDEFTLNFERIAQQDRMNKDARRKLEDQRKAFDRDKEELNKYRQFDTQLKTDPLGVLEKLGLPFDRIQQIAQQRNQVTDPKVLEARLKEEIKREFDQRDEQLKQERYSMEEIKLQTRISEVIRDEEFDIIETFEAETAVRDFMEQYYEETEEIPDIKIACEAITQALVGKINRIKNSKWMSSSEKKEAINELKVVQESIEETEFDKQIRKQGFKTISNKLSQTSSPKVSKHMSEDERIAAAIAQLI